MLSKDGTVLIDVQVSGGAVKCGCDGAATSVGAKNQNQSPAAVPERELADLILIATVIAAGCEPCAENAVGRALKEGSQRHIQRTLDIIAKIQKLDCFAKAIGTDVVARMEKALAAGRGTLRKAVLSADR